MTGSAWLLEEFATEKNRPLGDAISEFAKQFETVGIVELCPIVFLIVHTGSGPRLFSLSCHDDFQRYFEPRMLGLKLYFMVAEYIATRHFISTETSKINDDRSLPQALQEADRW